MRILLVTHFYPPEIGGAAARLHGLMRRLAESGHCVTVVTGFPNYPSGYLLEQYKGRLFMTEHLDGVKIIRTWIYASSHQRRLRRLANYLSFFTSGILGALITGRKYDIVIASSPPIFTGLAGLIIAHIFGIPFVFDVRDIFPDYAVEAGELSPSSPVTRFFRLMADILYKNADHITPVTERKQKKLIDCGVLPERVSVVKNGVDFDRLIVSNGHKRLEFGLEGKFVVLYAGLIGLFQGVDIAVKAADLLKENDDIHFMIVGDGVCRKSLIENASRLGLKNMTFVPKQPREEIPAFIKAADVCLVPLVSENLQDSVPSKLLEAWALKRPVILAADGEAAAIVRYTKGGVIIPPKNAGRLAQAILELRDNRSILKQYAASGHAYVSKFHDREILARNMEKVLVSVGNFASQSN